MVLILIFAEVLGLYGCVLTNVVQPRACHRLKLEPVRLIVALIMNTRASDAVCS